MAFPADGGLSGGVVLASSEGDLAFCQINLRLRSPEKTNWLVVRRLILRLGLALGPKVVRTALPRLAT